MKNWHVAVIILGSMILCLTVLSVVLDATTHEWHPIGPNVKFGTLLTVEGEGDERLLAETGAAVRGEPKPYVKERFEWKSNEITEDTVIFNWTIVDSEMVISATSFDFGPDSNAWVRFDWCSRHGEVRAVRVE